MSKSLIFVVIVFGLYIPINTWITFEADKAKERIEYKLIGESKTIEQYCEEYRDTDCLWVSYVR